MGTRSHTEMADKPRQYIVQVVKDYGKRLFRFIRGKVRTDEDAEDILQEVWYQFTNASAIGTIEQVNGWLFAVARNKITDKYRKQLPELLADYEYEGDEGESSFAAILLADDSQNPETTHLKNIFWEALFAALEELPENQRTVFVQNELEDKTLQQIADETGENLKTIISRKRYAVQHLRKQLQHLYDDLVNF
jgi:RNA polymerase sigma factor (sigma-70 family)